MFFSYLKVICKMLVNLVKKLVIFFIIIIFLVMLLYNKVNWKIFYCINGKIEL